MLRNLWTKIQSATDFWRFGGTLPGVTAIAVVVAARLVGLLQFQEWAAFDTFMRLRPVEPLDERILIVGINEADIQRIKKYPIPDLNLAALLQSLQTYQPTVIGLDIFRDLPQEPGNAELISTLKGIKNLIGVETILPDRNGLTVNPPPALLPKQIGFADAPIDLDGKQRRSFLGAFNLQNNWQYSFSLLLAKTYLETKGKLLENASDDGYSMRFNSTIIPRFLPNSGGYIRAKVSGTEMLINLRSNRTPFRIVSLEQIQTRKIEANWIRGKIILIGITGSSAKDYVTSAATKSENSSLIYGVEIQAHVVSQIVSAVLDERPLLNTWADIWEYLWIVAWGMLGITFGRTIRSPFRILFLVAITSIGLLGICYGLLIVGWWIPVVPACLILVFNSAIIAAFYQYEEVLQLRITNRQLIIDQTFNAIHNGPLQMLSLILKAVQDNKELTPQKFLLDLQKLNQELRDVYDLVRREILTESSKFDLRLQQLDLQQPMHEILYEVYCDVLERDYHCFKSIKTVVVKFQQMNERNLSIEHKRGICRFLEEALCNVGKYARGATWLDVICTQQQGYNVIRVADNGVGMDVVRRSHQGFGTQQAQILARQLKGKFQRFPNLPQGTVCELTWSGLQLRLWRF